MIQLLYQHPKTGDTWELSAAAKSLRWSSKRTGSPAALDFEVLGAEGIAWEHGGIVTMKEDNIGRFYGYVFKVDQRRDNPVAITAYDQIRYLKNKDTYVFSGKRADEIVAKIAADFKLRVGSLANTGYAIPSMVEDNQTLIDIICKALDHTVINTGQLFYLWDDYGQLRLSSVQDTKLSLVVGDGSLAKDYTYSSEINSDTYNKIKLVQNNTATGKRDVYIVQDSDNMKLWGTLQHFEVVNENFNPAQIAARGNNLLELKNRPKRSFEITGISDLSIRAGRAVFIKLSELGLAQFFVVEEASHDLIKKTMSLKLKVV